MCLLSRETIHLGLRLHPDTSPRPPTTTQHQPPALKALGVKAEALTLLLRVFSLRNLDMCG